MSGREWSDLFPHHIAVICTSLLAWLKSLVSWKRAGMAKSREEGSPVHHGALLRKLFLDRNWRGACVEEELCNSCKSGLGF